MSNQGLYFGQIVVGPAGSGKSTYCSIMQEMAQTLKRNILIVNLDPAAEIYKYRCDIDIKDLITLDDVMQQLQLGPNGALIYCMEYLMQNTDWIQQQLNEVGNDDYVIFDCPGQIQLYSHLDVFKDLVKFLQNYGFSLCSVYMLDITFIGQNSKFLSGMLQALAAQISLELPGVTILSKCDLIKDKQKIQAYINYTDQLDQSELNFNNQQSTKIAKLDRAIRKIIESNSTISFRQLDINDQDSIRDILIQIDNAIQYGQNLEPDDKIYQQAQESMNQRLQDIIEKN